MHAGMVRWIGTIDSSFPQALAQIATKARPPRNAQTLARSRRRFTQTLVNSNTGSRPLNLHQSSRGRVGADVVTRRVLGWTRWEQRAEWSDRWSWPRCWPEGVANKLSKPQGTSWGPKGLLRWT